MTSGLTFFGRGKMTKITMIKIGIILALFAGLSAVWWLYRSELREGARQAAEIVQQQAEIADRDQEIDDLREAVEKERQVSARREERREASRLEIKDMRDELARLEKENQELADWDARDLPDELYRVLRGIEDGNGVQD